MSRIQSRDAVTLISDGGFDIDRRMKEVAQKQKKIAENERIFSRREPDKKSLSFRYRDLTPKRNGSSLSPLKAVRYPFGVREFLPDLESPVSSNQPPPFNGEEDGERFGSKDTYELLLDERCNISIRDINESYLITGEQLSPLQAINNRNRFSLEGIQIENSFDEKHCGNINSYSSIDSTTKTAFFTSRNSEDDQDIERYYSALGDETTTPILSTRDIIKKFKRDKKLFQLEMEPQNISIKYLKENKVEEIRKSQEMYRQTLEEAKNIERKCVTCIKEANIFAEILQREHRYRMIARDEEEDAKWNQIMQNDQCNDVELPLGVGKRIEKMLIESFDVHSEEQKMVFSSQYFFLEHSRLRDAVKKSRSTLATTAGLACAVDRQDILERSQFINSINADLEINIHTSGSNKRASSSGIAGGSGSAIIQKQVARGNGTSDKDKKNAFQDFIDQLINDANDQETAALPTTTQQERSDVLNLVKEILDETVLRAKRIEKQIRTIHNRGWNIDPFQRP